MRTNKLRAFTVVELLVVVAIIALLVGILLPAIGKARDAALTTQSQSNLRQIGAAWQTYAGEYGDRQMTFINDYMARYNTTNQNYGNAGAVCPAYMNANGEPHPPIIIGYVQSQTNPNQMVIYWAVFGGPGTTVGNWTAALIRAQPIVFNSPTPSHVKLGTWKVMNFRPLSSFMNGRFYDPVFYAPKDRGVMNLVGQYFENPYESQFIVNASGATVHYWSSYVLSPAAMFNPDVMSEQHGAPNFDNAPLFNNPWQMPSGFKSPGLSQARYANLKTLAIEHHWLQNNKRGNCNPAWTAASATYDGCEPWYFNASILSNPAAVFYDGHVGMVGVRDAMDSNQRVLAQHGQTLTSGTKGLWSKNTPLGGTYEPPAPPAIPQGGYAHNAWAADGACTSFHVLTSYGIKGRDIIPK